MIKAGNKLKEIEFKSLSLWKRLRIIILVILVLIGGISLFYFSIEKIFDGDTLYGIIFFVLGIACLVITIYEIKHKDWNSILRGSAPF